MQNSQNTRSKFRILSTLFLWVTFFGLLAVGFWGWNNKWEIHDRWSARNYEATTDSSRVLKNLNLTSKGELVYKASKTEVDGKGKFKTLCPVERYEQASVLGCYTQRKIYVLKVDEPKLSGVEEVTAAHELLHAKFERMDEDQKVKLKSLLGALESEITDPETLSLVASYKTEIGDGRDLDNEKFAIFGTQLADVGPELEEVYSEYFKNRTQIVEFYKKYNGEFKAVEAQVVGFDKQLEDLKAQKDKLENDLKVLNEDLEFRQGRIEELQNSDGREEYASEVKRYNNEVGAYNIKVEQIKTIIAEYNQIVELRNTVALSAKNLQDKLDANVEEKSVD
jgi:hypothetical protein